MNPKLKLMCVLAHPDDESLGLGGTLAKYAAEGVLISLLLATRGERGWQGDPKREPSPRTLGRIREAEVRAAASVLGINDLAFLGYIDGTVAHVDPLEATARIVAEIRVARPDVVVTFGPDGVYGHPDHVAITQLTTVAVARAADPAYDDGFSSTPHQVAKLYYRIWTGAEQAALEAVLGEVAIEVNGEYRRWVSWPEWAVSARLDTSAYRATVARAVACHTSQIGGNAVLRQQRLAAQDGAWDTQHFYRALSTVDSPAVVEDDLFAGLRRAPQTMPASSAPDARAFAAMLATTAGWGR